MFPPALGEVLFKATSLAQRSGAPEINIDLRLAALDAPEVDPSSLLAMPPDLAGSECYGFSFNSDWISLSTDAAEALAPFAEMETVDRDTLRKALRAAKQG